MEVTVSREVARRVDPDEDPILAALEELPVYKPSLSQQKQQQLPHVAVETKKPAEAVATGDPGTRSASDGDSQGTSEGDDSEDGSTDEDDDDDEEKKDEREASHPNNAWLVPIYSRLAARLATLKQTGAEKMRTRSAVPSIPLYSIPEWGIHHPQSATAAISVSSDPQPAQQGLVLQPWRNPPPVHTAMSRVGDGQPAPW